MAFCELIMWTLLVHVDFIFFFFFLGDTFLLFRWFIVLFQKWTALGSITATIKIYDNINTPTTVDELNSVLSVYYWHVFYFAVPCLWLFQTYFLRACGSMQRRIYIKIESFKIGDRLKDLLNIGGYVQGVIYNSQYFQ